MQAQPTKRPRVRKATGQPAAQQPPAPPPQPAPPPAPPAAAAGPAEPPAQPAGQAEQRKARKRKGEVLTEEDERELRQLADDLVTESQLLRRSNSSHCLYLNILVNAVVGPVLLVKCTGTVGPGEPKVSKYLVSDVLQPPALSSAVEHKALHLSAPACMHGLGYCCLPCIPTPMTQRIAIVQPH